MRATSLWICTGALLWLWGASSVEAARRPDRRHRGWKIKANRHLLAPPKTPAKRPLPQKKPRKALKLQDLERFTKIKVAEKLRTRIRDLKQIIRYAKSRERADLLFRLGEHYWELGRHHEFQGHKLDAYRRAPSWPEKRRLQALAWAQAKRHRRLAARAYFRIIKQHPGYKRLCETYYFLGKNLTAMGQAKQALQVYKTMIKRFATQASSCPLLPNAYLAFGEYYFLQGHVRTALQSYRQVLHFRSSSIYGFALYKIAWCQYNLAQYRPSLRTFVQVVQYASRRQGRHKVRRVRLLREALRDLVLAYSRVGEASTAYRQFTQWGGPSHARTMLKALGQLYREQGQFAQIVTTYRKLQQLDATKPTRLLYQLYITRAIDRSQTKAQTLRAVSRLIQLTRWARKHHKGARLVVKVDKAIASQLAAWAKHRHYAAQKTRRKPYYQQAARFYAAYLALYPKGKRAYEMGFFRAQVLSHLKRHEAAGRAYLALQRSSVSGKFDKDIAYHPILSYDALLQTSAPVQTKARWRGLLIQAAKRYLRRYPRSKEAVDVAYRLGRIYYDEKRYDAARRQLQRLTRRFPRHEYALYSAHTLLDIDQLQGRWERLAKSATAFAAQMTFPAADRKTFGALARKARLKGCRVHEKKGRFGRAAGCYRAFADRHPSQRGLTEIALHNGALAYQKSQQIDAAIRLSKRLLRQFPRSSYARKTLLGLASTYAVRAEFAQAAKTYERYLGAYKAEARRPKTQALYFDARLRAARYRDAVGDTAGALEHYRWLVAQSAFRQRHKKVAIGLYFRVAELSLAKGQGARYARYLRQGYEGRGKAGRGIRRMLPPSLQLVVMMKHARWLRRRGAQLRAKRLEDRVVKAFARLPQRQSPSYDKAKTAAAEASFRQAQRLQRRYHRYAWSGRPSRKRRSQLLAKKRAALKASMAAYQRVIRYKQGRWGVAALTSAGVLTEDFGDFLRQSPAPPQKDLDAMARKLLGQALLARGIARRHHRQLFRQPRFRKLLQRLQPKFLRRYQARREQLARPYEATAMDLYRRALKLAHKLRSYHRWTLMARKRLARLQPNQYPAQLERLPAITFATSDFAFSQEIIGSKP